MMTKTTPPVHGITARQAAVQEPPEALEPPRPSGSMSALVLLESLESRAIRLRLAGGEIHADFAPGAFASLTTTWHKLPIPGSVL